MDMRKALEKGQVLVFDGGSIFYRIQKESARGGSSLVYDATYRDNIGEEKFVRIKECYPFFLTISREADGSLVPDPDSEAAFAREKENMRAAYRQGNEFFKTDGLTNFTANTYNLYEANQTIYIVSSYAQGEKLSYRADRPLEENISLVRTTALVIQKIHDRGYLYLDIKPDNIFVFEGTTEIIQLFDFDSLFPIRSAQRTASDYHGRISYTKGFAALEQKMGDPKRIGIYSDVYGIGALLFYLIFHRTPNAPDCGPDAEYDFTLAGIPVETYPDKLFFRLVEFFRRTLANYYLDRYPDMGTVLEELDELKKLANLTTPFFYSTRISKPGFLLGRTKEKQWLSRWFAGNERNALFLTGMGGIGKSTLIRTFLAENARNFDGILCVNYNVSLQKTILDDRQIKISTVEKNEKESEEEYFTRKLNAIRQISLGKQIVLVIEDYTGDKRQDLSAILRIPWKVILVTRRKALAEGYDCLEVFAIQKRKSLYALFENYLGKPLQEADFPYLDRIIEKTAGHTLVLELIAKQIAKSYLSIKTASALAGQYGFLHIAPEKVVYTKDFVTYHETVCVILAQLFEVAQISEEKSLLLKILTFFGSQGIDADLFARILNLPFQDNINELHTEGWLHLEEKHLTMHPVIREMVLAWPVTTAVRTALVQVLTELSAKLPMNTSTVFCKPITTDYPEIVLYRELAEHFLRELRPEWIPGDERRRRSLMYQVMLLMPREREDDILRYSEELLPYMPDENPFALLVLYKKILEIYYEKRDLAGAAKKLAEAGLLVRRCHDPYIWGEYYRLRAEYYEYRLNGVYDAVTDEEKNDYKFIIRSLNQAIRYMKRSKYSGCKQLLTEYYRAKTTVMLRNPFENPARIRKMRFRLQSLAEKYALPETELIRNYHMTLAWYYTYIERNREKTGVHLSIGCRISRKLCMEKLDLMDEFLIPCANILVEWQEYDRSAECLIYGIQECRRQKDVLVYVRKKAELMRYLLEVFCYGGDFEKARVLLRYLEEVVNELGECEINKTGPFYGSV